MKQLGRSWFLLGVVLLLLVVLDAFKPEYVPAFYSAGIVALALAAMCWWWGYCQEKSRQQEWRRIEEDLAKHLVIPVVVLGIEPIHSLDHSSD